jgi:hypothetical protein
MDNLITLTRLSRRLDISPAVIQRRIAANLIHPVAHTDQGHPLFDASLLEEYRATLSVRVKGGR